MSSHFRSQCSIGLIFGRKPKPASVANVFLGTSLRSLRDVFSVGEFLENTMKSQNLVKIFTKDFNCKVLKALEAFLKHALVINIFDPALPPYCAV